MVLKYAQPQHREKEIGYWVEQHINSAKPAKNRALTSLPPLQNHRTKE